MINVLSICLFFNVVAATFPFQQCGNEVCNLSVTHCDSVINSCSSCEDDCDPSRINGRRFMIDACEKSCASWYLLTNPASIRSRSIKAKIATAQFNTTEGVLFLPFLTCGNTICDLTRQYCHEDTCIKCKNCNNRTLCNTCEGSLQRPRRPKDSEIPPPVQTFC